MSILSLSFLFPFPPFPYPSSIPSSLFQFTPSFLFLFPFHLCVSFPSVSVHPLSLSQPCTLGFLHVSVRLTRKSYGNEECIQGFPTGYRYRTQGFQTRHPCADLCLIGECWVASKGDSVLMRLRSRAEVERQLLNAYLAVSGKRGEREGKGGMNLLCVDKQGCSEGDSCLTTGAYDNP